MEGTVSSAQDQPYSDFVTIVNFEILVFSCNPRRTGICRIGLDSVAVGDESVPLLASVKKKSDYLNLFRPSKFSET